MSGRFLCHFTFFQYTEAYWLSSAADRVMFREAFLKDIRDAVQRFDLYQVFPARSDVDFLLWVNMEVDDPQEPASIFSSLAKIIYKQRAWILPVQTMWGLTGASSYARGKSAQAIDPLADERKPYLIVYPFVKTTSWYQTGKDARQGMMNEHIRIGHQYEHITQLLLYSTGLQDQEFVVIYETDDLGQFTSLVTELRGSDARPYTERDTPLYTAFYHSPEETLGLAE